MTSSWRRTSWPARSTLRRGEAALRQPAGDHDAVAGADASATCSAVGPNALALRRVVSPFSQSPVSGVAAARGDRDGPRSATAVPDGVAEPGGHEVRLPATVAVVFSDVPFLRGSRPGFPCGRPGAMRTRPGGRRLQGKETEKFSRRSRRASAGEKLSGSRSFAARPVSWGACGAHRAGDSDCPGSFVTDGGATVLHSSSLPHRSVTCSLVTRGCCRCGRGPCVAVCW